MRQRYFILSTWITLASQVGLSSVAVAGSRSCDNAHAALQSDLAITSSGADKIIAMELGRELPSISQNLESQQNYLALPTQSMFGSIQFRQFQIASIDAGTPIAHCKNFDCTVTLPIHQLKIHTNVKFDINAANNVVITLSKATFTLKAHLTSDPLHPFSFEPSGSGLTLGTKSIAINAPTSGVGAAGDSPGGPQFVNAFGKMITDDSMSQAFTAKVGDQINTNILPLVETRVNAALTQLPLFASDVAVNQVPTLPDLDLRITAANIDLTQQTIELLLSACTQCMQSAPNGQPSTSPATWLSSPKGPGPDASTYDIAAGVPYSSINRALSDLQKKGDLNICTNALSQITTCPAVGQPLPAGESRFNVSAPPTVGYDSNGFYIDVPSLSIKGVQTVGGLEGGLKLYVNLTVSADGSKISLDKAKVIQTLSVRQGTGIGNFLYNDLLSSTVSDQINSTITGDLKSKTLDLPAGISLKYLQAGPSGIRAFANFDESAPVVQAIVQQ